jgi:hypothetical protein
MSVAAVNVRHIVDNGWPEVLREHVEEQGPGYATKVFSGAKAIFEGHRGVVHYSLLELFGRQAGAVVGVVGHEGLPWAGSQWLFRRLARCELGGARESVGEGLAVLVRIPSIADRDSN